MCEARAAGVSGLSGPRLALAEAIDRRFLQLASGFGAEPHAYGPLLPVAALRKIDYFSSFPHLVMFPQSAQPGEENLREFAARNGSDASGPLATVANAPADCVLAPAACYAVYIAHEGTESAMPRAVTVRGTCFRNESIFEPLIRQPSFSMREIVHMGDSGSVKTFLDEARARVVEIAGQWGLAPSLQVATDPFFDPARSPKYLHAKLFPSKEELVEEGVAIASFNNHRNFFGKAFEIRACGEPIHTACAAFGIERWVAAILKRHGPEPANWPVPVGGSAYASAGEMNPSLEEQRGVDRRRSRRGTVPLSDPARKREA
jgi:seryl-tRNA synthetase